MAAAATLGDMEIDLNTLTAAIATLDDLASSLAANLPCPASAELPDVDQALRGLYELHQQTRLARRADLADLGDGLARARQLWQGAEISLTAGPR